MIGIIIDLITITVFFMYLRFLLANSSIIIVSVVWFTITFLALLIDNFNLITILNLNHTPIIMYYIIIVIPIILIICIISLLLIVTGNEYILKRIIKKYVNGD